MDLVTCSARVTSAVCIVLKPTKMRSSPVTKAPVAVRCWSTGVIAVLSGGIWLAAYSLLRKRSRLPPSRSATDWHPAVGALCGRLVCPPPRVVIFFRHVNIRERDSCFSESLADITPAQHMSLLLSLRETWANSKLPRAGEPGIPNRPTELERGSG